MFEFDGYFERAEHLDGAAKCYTPRDGVTCTVTETGEDVFYVAFWPKDKTPHFENHDCDVVADGWNEVVVKRPQFIDNGCCG